MYLWHFTIRGPPKTDFEGGVYHGKILLPPEYPFKPPNIIFSTPNGRFQVGTKICLSISAYHPEHWQPAWGIRLILEALISFLPTPGEGAIGALDWKPEERKRLANESREWRCAECGLVSSLLPPVPEGGIDVSKSTFKDEISQLHMHAGMVTPEKTERKTPGNTPSESEGEASAPVTPSPTPLSAPAAASPTLNMPQVCIPCPPSPTPKPSPKKKAKRKPPSPPPPVLKFWDPTDVVSQTLAILGVLFFVLGVRFMADLGSDLYLFSIGEKVSA